MKVLITGGAGFAGHHVIEHILKNKDWEIVVIDRLNYASNGWNRLRDIQAYDDKRVMTIISDFSCPLSEGVIKEIGSVDYILHMGAETHVDNSIKNPEPFVMANVLGTMRMLEFARSQKDLKQFVYFSTDEVFGPAPEGVNYREWDRYNSANPYAAAKAGGEELTLAYGNTYKIPVLITHTMNLFGERQHPEKFIPLIIKRTLKGEKVFIHSDKEKKNPGIRSYIHCRNMASALLFLINEGTWAREKFNIVGEKEVDNLELALKIADIIGKPLNYELIDFHSLRPGHDLRYALDGNKLLELGWNQPKNFEESLERAVRWTLENPQWLEEY
jgi:dTDP-glucose 4,6-dehydratase